MKTAGRNEDSRSFGGELLAALGTGGEPVRYRAELASRPARHAEWPQWAHPSVVAAYTERGIQRPYTHQVHASELAHAGTNVIIATSTASGKSLAYRLPILSALAADPNATALYIAPTKALCADQLRATLSLTDTHPGLSGIGIASYDGDSPIDSRDWVRDNARWVLSNPDMIHRSMLGRHPVWQRLLRNLRYIVVDEAHHYSGVFGSNVALVLRRLNRVCARYGSHPVYILASATTADPAAAARALLDADCAAVTEDESPQGPRTLAFWQPPPKAGTGSANGMRATRRSAATESAAMLAGLVREGARTLCFVRSRAGAEVVSTQAREILRSTNSPLATRIAAYRAGYLPEERHALERAINDGRILGTATTSALELGVDIAGLDAIVMAGYPGSRASFWQRAGRAGRRGQGCLVVLVAGDDPLDTYILNNPHVLTEQPVEHTVIDPTNPYLLGPHVLCAAAELPLHTTDVARWQAGPVCDTLAAHGLLRLRGDFWHFTGDDELLADLDLRGAGTQVTIVDGSSGRVLGTTDTARAPAALHPGAVHLHRGESFVVDELDLDEGVAMVHPGTPGWTTSALSQTTIEISAILSQHSPAPGAEYMLSRVNVTHRVVGYLRRLADGTVLDRVSLDLPPQHLPTTAVVYTVSTELLQAAGIEAAQIPGALHAAEHAAIGLLPIFATCDRNDIGGLSTAWHPDTGLATVFVYDGHPGGAGFAERGYAVFTQWLRATRDTIAACECATGCPGCVQSPKCGNGNSPLSKQGAIALLTALVARSHDQSGPVTTPSPLDR